MSHRIGTAFLQSAISRFRSYKQLGDRSFAQLETADLHYRPNEQSNSIATIITHLSGNMLSRWTNFLTEDGEKPWRQRDEEFGTNQLSKEALLELWEKGWGCLLTTLESLKEEDLLTTIYIRKEPLTAIDAINRQLVHYPSHVGQIMYIGKLLKGAAWQSLSIAPGQSQQYNDGPGVKDPGRPR
ncbi:MAG: DUF1572 family protein [Candidatus Pseudobacter hemicellulosilyticus]|uniref:DUF1572 family protein n=1 Tax=Candidatus Pseudobacter hemicellulosilyticus TaxID=3121375 RepID=A0AAJ5WSP4_9BACT|nr:MAG: DUF1572 family protein [Pseudobacter sp.]